MTKPTESSRFLEAMKRIVSVPKVEIDRREAAARVGSVAPKGQTKPAQGNALGSS